MTEQARPVSFAVLSVLAATGALGSIAIHMMVPAMPSVAAELSASPGDVQLAISVYLACLGLGQLIGGALSDVYGRRPTMIVAILVFLAGSVGVAVCQSVAQLIAFRMLEALGGGSAIIASRTLVADRSASADVAPRIALMTSIVLLSPAISPLLGGIITRCVGWRIIFVVLSGIAVLSLLFTLKVSESRTFARSPSALLSLAGSYRRVAANKLFWRYALAIGCASSGMYIFLGGSSFLLIDRYGLTSDQAGFCYLLVAAFGIVGTFLVRHMEKGAGAFRTGLLFGVVGGFCMLAAGFLKQDNPVGLILPMLVVATGAGLSAPTGFAAVLSVVEGASGVASSMSGAFQMMFSGTAATLIAQAGLSEITSLGAAIFLVVFVGWLIAPSGRVIRS